MTNVIAFARTASLCAAISLMAGCATTESMDAMESDSMEATTQSANPMVGGAEMFATRNIIENAVNSRDHTTLVAAVKAAGLVETLSGPGPFTVFAPTNAAFAKLPAGTVDTLLKPENKAQLQAVLTYHVVPGRLTAANLASRAQQSGGRAMLKTVNGANLTVSAAPGGGWMLTDTKGGTSRITTADVIQSNGVIHVVDGVSLP